MLVLAKTCARSLAGYLPALAYALIAQRIEYRLAEPGIEVQFLLRAMAMAGGKRRLAPVRHDCAIGASGGEPEIRGSNHLGHTIKIKILLSR